MNIILYINFETYRFERSPMLDFVALDFETANKFKNSACSFGGYYRKGWTDYKKGIQPY